MNSVSFADVAAAVLATAAITAFLLWRRGASARCLIAFAALVCVEAAYVAVYKDDSFIIFRYARQLLAGNGPNFNAGERVEGYTTPLWVVLSVLAGAGGLDIPLAMRVVAFAANLALLPVLYWFYARVLAPDTDARARALALVAPALVATNGAFPFWAMGAMETVPFALAVTVGVALACHALADLERRDWSPLAFTLAYLVRPEGALFLVVTQLVRAVVLRRARRPVFAGPRTWTLLLLAVALIATHVAWRWWYYGVPLPNTFYTNAAVTEAGWGRGLRYVERSFGMYFGASRYLGLDRHLIAASPLLPGALLGLGLRAFDRRRLPLYFSVVVYLCYVVAVGGERLGTYRFTVPVLPLLYLMVADGVRTVVDLPKHLTRGRVALPRTMSALAFVLTFLVAYGQLYATAADIRVRRDINVRAYVERSDMAAVLCSFLRPDQTIAVIPAGVIPYFCMVPTIDMLGLNDAHIGRKSTATLGAGKPGHEKWDGAYVLSRRPTVIVLGLGLLTRDPRDLAWERIPDALSLLWGSDEIWNDPRLREDYEFRYALLPTTKRWFGYFVRRDAAG